MKKYFADLMIAMFTINPFEINMISKMFKDLIENFNSYFYCSFQIIEVDISNPHLYHPVIIVLIVLMSYYLFF